MSEVLQIERLSDELIAQLRAAPVLASLAKGDKLHCLDGTRVLRLEAGEVLLEPLTMPRKFWILLEGNLRGIPRHGRGEGPPFTLEPGTIVGEIVLLTNSPIDAEVRASTAAKLLELDEEQFWRLMASCPEVRQGILDDLAERMRQIRRMTSHQEKMASLGILAAGLMHELNNPGSAAKRAASQLRGNLDRMHELGAKFSKGSMNEEQKRCLYELQTYALTHTKPKRMNSVEQMDAEEHLAEWMEEAQVEDAWKLAPTLVAIGIGEEDLSCARESFNDGPFADALSWVEAMVSSQQLVGTIEESIGRVSDLVQAVKSYAYEGKGQRQAVDINDSIHATLVILGHKMREKQIVLQKEFGAGMPKMQTECSGLNQIWTNLLDNSIDAVAQGGTITVKTWPEKVNGRTDLYISIRDDGAGIPLESQPQIFDPFYTTKPVGIGTGLGLGIVHRIVEQYGGTIRFSSQPGCTEFVVRLPAERV